MNPSKKRRQFGLWSSAIQPISLARGISFSDVAWNEDGTLVWRDGRSDRGVVVLQPPDEHAFRDLNDEYGVRAKVGYGGGDFSVGKGVVFFVESDSGRIYRQPVEAGPAHPITPAYGQTASPVLSPDGHWLLFIRSYEGRDSPEIVDAEGKLWPQKLDDGSDFYMQPVWHPGIDQERARIAWVSWDHPNMPWDGTYLRFARLRIDGDSLPSLEEVETVVGDEGTSIFQPEFSPDGRYLAYVSDESGWWQIYLRDLESGETRQLTDAPAEHGQPAWVQGLRTYDFAPDGKRLYFLRNQEGFTSLWRLDLSGGSSPEQIPTEPYTFLDQPRVSPDGQRIAMIASAGKTPTRIITVDLPQGGSQKAVAQVWRRSISEEIPAEQYAAPQAIEWKGMDGGTAYGLFYEPQNPDFEGIGLPPLMVLVHGGPTSQRRAAFNQQAQFFTSRGYAVLDVNYRGSTGYGREYRDKLKGNWGIYDVEDSVSGARHLAQQGLIDAGRKVIMGGSAGGFTVLKALEDYPGEFKAGICLYGVADQFNLVRETHKFEAHYSDSLLGPLPQAADLYRQRSPINFVDKIQDPLAVFQGEKDQVVPRSQSDELVKTLQRRGVPHIYHIYEGEGHGFRKTETLVHFYKTVEEFLQKYVIFA